MLFVPSTLGFKRDSIPLLCLDARGRELWRFMPGSTVRRGAAVAAPPYIVRQFMVFDSGRILVTSHHHHSSAAQIALLDSQGKVLREY